MGAIAERNRLKDRGTELDFTASAKAVSHRHTRQQNATPACGANDSVLAGSVDAQKRLRSLGVYDNVELVWRGGRHERLHRAPGVPCPEGGGAPWGEASPSGAYAER